MIVVILQKNERTFKSMEKYCEITKQSQREGALRLETELCDDASDPQTEPEQHGHSIPSGQQIMRKTFLILQGP